MNYKDPEKHKGFERDLQQVLAYVLAADLREAWIVYSKTMPPIAHRICGRTIHRIGLDLSRDPSGVLSEVRGIANRLRESFEQSTPAALPS